MEILGVWVLLAGLIGLFAYTKGRSGFGWFLLAVVITPLLAGVFLLVLPTQAKTPA